MVSSIIVAAGKGVRLDHTAPKQYMDLAGRPLLAHCLEAFNACSEVESIFLVIQKKDFEYCKKEILSPLDLQDKVNLVPGGTHRQDSVFNGLKVIGKKGDTVVIHDGVRPFIRADDISACIRGAIKFGACILGIPTSDTLKHVGKSDIIEKTLTREVVWFAQTPQAFQYELILKAHETARLQGFKGTDDAMLVERLGVDVKMINGSKRNIKITTREDLMLAEAIYNLNLA
jgi:2-C-methyl-D-erythritol 4-phosphate cytidylyltransferase